MTCPDCASAQLQPWPIYRAGCDGCFKRAMAYYRPPQSHPPPTDAWIDELEIYVQGHCKADAEPSTELVAQTPEPTSPQPQG